MSKAPGTGRGLPQRGESCRIDQRRGRAVGEINAAVDSRHDLASDGDTNAYLYLDTQGKTPIIRFLHSQFDERQHLQCELSADELLTLSQSHPNGNRRQAWIGRVIPGSCQVPLCYRPNRRNLLCRDAE